MNRVWYASYGSNLSAERFRCYIEGGTPQGSRKPNDGCRDPTPPLDRVPLSLNYDLYFAKDSASWKGGVAFIKRGDRPVNTLGRMYLITEDQFNDVVLQENSKPVDGRRILPPFVDLTRNKEIVLRETGWYTRILFLGDREGHPVFTITNAQDDLKPNQPGEPYIKVIATGIKETYPLMTDAQICEYLSRADGIRGAILPEHLAAWVTGSSAQ